jgi:hypothetical protein
VIFWNLLVGLQIEEVITALSLGAEQRLSAIIQQLRRLLGDLSVSAEPIAQSDALRLSR